MKTIDRMKYKLRTSNLNPVEYYLSSNPIVLFNEPHFSFYSGSFDVKKESTFLNEILISEKLNLDDIHDNCNFLESDRGLLIQLSKFKREHYTPLYRWFKKREIYNEKLFTLMIKLSLSIGIYEVAKYMDNSRNYTINSYYLGLRES